MIARDDSFQKVLPQLLGISFALVLFGVLTDKTVLLYAALLVLFGLIIKAKFLVQFGEVLHLVVGKLGHVLVVISLGLVYFVFVTPYSFLYRLLEKKTVDRFKAKSETKTYFIDATTSYTKEYFEQPW